MVFEPRMPQAVQAHYESYTCYNITLCQNGSEHKGFVLQNLFTNFEKVYVISEETQVSAAISEQMRVRTTTERFLNL